MSLQIPERKKPGPAKVIVLCLCLLALIVVLTTVTPVSADAASPSLLKLTPPPDPLEPEDIEQAAAEASGSTDEQEPVGPPSVTQIIQNITKNIVQLSERALIAAYEAVVQWAVKKDGGVINGLVEESLQQTLFMVSFYNADGLDGLNNGVLVEPTHNMWKAALAATTPLFGLLLLSNIMTVYVGDVHVEGRVREVIQLLSSTLLRIFLAVISFWLTTTALKAAWGISGVIAEYPMGGVFVPYSATEMKLFVATLVALLFAFMATPIGLLFFYVILAILVGVLLILAILLTGHFAFIAITVMWIVSAPVLIILGGLPGFRWADGLWKRISLVIVLFPLASVIGLRGGYVMISKFSDLQGGALAKTMTALAFFSLLIFIHMTTLKLVYGPLIEVGKQVRGIMTSLRNQAIGAVGFAAGLAGGNAALGSLANASGGPIRPGGAGMGLSKVPALTAGSQNTGSSRQSGNPADEASPQASQTTGRVEQLGQRAKQGQLSSDAHRNAMTRWKTSRGIASSLASKDPMYGALNRMSNAATDGAMASIGDQIPQENPANSLPSEFVKPKGVMNSVLGGNRSNHHPMKALVQARANFSQRILGREGMLAAVEDTGHDPQDYVSNVVAMSLSDRVRTNLGEAGIQAREYAPARQQMDVIGSSLSSGAREMHDTLVEQIDHYYNSGWDITQDALQGWIDEARNR